jgi:head-tail adaptor
MSAYYPTPIGYFRDRVNVKKVQRVENGRGGWTETENDIGTFWAFLEPASVLLSKVFCRTDNKRL